MPAADDAPDEFAYGPHDQFRHDLKSSLTTIHGRAFLLARSVRRSPSLGDAERTQMLEGVAAIEAAVRQMVTVIDSLGHERGDASADPEEAR
jgi:hypothetical protein